jgi:hypothetical protein
VESLGGMPSRYLDVQAAKLNLFSDAAPSNLLVCGDIYISKLPDSMRDNYGLENSFLSE